MASTRDTLIDTATELFLGRSYSSVGTTELCSAAGVNKGTFYHFFSSKSELLVAAVDRYAASFAGAFHDIAVSDAPAVTRLERLFEVPAKANENWKASHGFVRGCLVGNMSLELSVIEEPVRKAVQQAFATWRKPIRIVVDDLIAEGSLQEIDRDAGADVIIALLQGGLLLAKAHNDPSRITLLSSGALAHLKTLSS